MRAIKLTVNVLLGIGTLLVFNENIHALWLNALGMLCAVALILINHQGAATQR